MPQYEKPPHGTLKRYQSKTWPCRCQDCKTANTEAWKQQRAERMVRLAADPTLITHGTYNGYHNWGCKCDPCLNAVLNIRRVKAGLPPRPDNPVRVPGQRGVNPLRGRTIQPAHTGRTAIYPGRGGRRITKAKPFGREWLDDAV